jgi:hypothetical protein
VSIIPPRVSKELRYPVLSISSIEHVQEPLGSKEKFWYREKEEDFLFKRSREGTGEHWAEKAACELASLLKLPHAVYHLATWKECLGVVTPNFAATCALAHGNEFLAQCPEYERVKHKQPLYTLGRVLAVLKTFDGCPLFRSTVDKLSALEIFSGYLLFDAWISNQDRHHENWGFLLLKEPVGAISIAPTFDHAASLGCIENDKSKSERLQTGLPERGVEAFVKKAKSAFYREREGCRMSTIEVFEAIAKETPQGSLYWMSRLKDVSDKDVEGVFAKFDENIISDISIEFAMEMLRINRKRILGCDIT